MKVCLGHRSDDWATCILQPMIITDENPQDFIWGILISTELE